MNLARAIATAADGNQPRGPKRWRGAALLCTALVIAPLTAAVRAQVEEEDLGEVEMEVFAPREPTPVEPEWALLLRDAERALFNADPRTAEALLDQAIDGLAPIAEGANPPERGRALLARSLATRARIHLDRGVTEAAVDDLRRAIAAEPTLTLERIDAPSALTAQFDAIRADMVGTLELEVLEPPDLELRVDDRRVTDARDNETGALVVLAGTRTLRARRPGFAPYAVTIDVPAGGTVPVDVTLERTGPVLRIVTQPRGAVVVLDGIARGVTEGEASDRVVPEGSRAARSKGTFSAPFLMANVPLGNHQLEVTLDGHRSFRAPLSISEAIDYEIPPIVLESERGRLLLRGVDAEARVRIDGETVETRRTGGGATVDLAPGAYEIVIDRGPTAMFTRQLQLADRQTIEIDVRLRPGLGLLGTLGDDREAAQRVTRLLTEAVRDSGRWTLVNHAEATSSILADQGISASVLRDAQPAVDWTALQGTLDRATAGLLYVLPVLSDDLLATHVDFWIWPAAPGPARPDRVRLPLDEPGGVARMARLLDHSIQLHQPWLGAQVIDSTAARHPLVVAVTDGGPAAVAGLRVGDQIVSISDVSVADHRALTRQIDAAEIGEPIAIKVQGPNGDRTTHLTLGTSPTIMNHHAEDRLYAVAHANLTLLEREVPAADRWIVQLNRAKVFLHLSDWIGAARELRAIQPPAAPNGVGQASIDYWIGVALAAAGTAYRETAIDAFDRAANQPGARLHHNDGPWIAPRARARRHALDVDR